MSRFPTGLSPLVRPLTLPALALIALLTATGAWAKTPGLVVYNAKILTMAPDQKAPITGYLSADADGKILAVAAGAPPARVKAGAKLVDAHGDYMMPGFISSHSHIWQAAWRGLAEDKTTPSWVNDLYGDHAIRSTPQDTYWFTLLGSLDHLKHGITTAFDFALDRGKVSNADNAYDQAQFKAKMDAGLRFVHGYAPRATGAPMRVGATPPSTFQQSRADLIAFLDWTKAQPNGAGQFLSVALSGASAGDDPTGAAKLMKEFGLGNQVHYLEAPDNQEAQRAQFKSYVDAGLLQPGLFWGHFIHTDDDILRQTAQAKAGMSWQPLSNGRLASGVADIPKYLKMGVRVGMGVDGQASADLADPFENMRNGLYAIRAKYQDPKVMSPYDVMWLHTMGSADVMGVKDKVGSLEPGKYADFLLVRPQRLGVALEDLYANIVFVTAEQDIDAVYVGGVLRVDRAGVVKRDVARVQAEVDKRILAIH